MIKDQRGLASMVYKFVDKMFATSACAIKSEIMSSQQLAEKLHKPIIRKLGKCKVYSYLIDKVWGADLADPRFIRNYNKEDSIFIIFN